MRRVLAAAIGLVVQAGPAWATLLLLSEDRFHLDLDSGALSTLDVGLPATPAPPPPPRACSAGPAPSADVEWRCVSGARIVEASRETRQGGPLVLTARDRATGRVLWTRRTRDVQVDAYDLGQGGLALGLGDAIHVTHRDTGRPMRPPIPLPGHRFGLLPLADHRWLAVGVRDLVVLDAAGAPRWRRRIDDLLAVAVVGSSIVAAERMGPRDVRLRVIAQDRGRVTRTVDLWSGAVDSVTARIVPAGRHAVEASVMTWGGVAL